MSMVVKTSGWNVTVRSVLKPGLVDLQKFMFRERYHIKASVYFKEDSTISGAFQCSKYAVGASPTCTSFTNKFLGVESPFLDEVGPSGIVWCNCCLIGCVGAFSQFLKCFSELLVQLMTVPQWGDFSFFWWEVCSNTTWEQFC